ncbi:MAG: hypothetical protein PHW60_02555 [Kiritimatiellae bacterium]|nr:hypothetical protein [Kiritimatiellia bacterium]
MDGTVIVIALMSVAYLFLAISSVVRVIGAIFSPRLRVKVKKHPVLHIVWLFVGLILPLLFTVNLARIKIRMHSLQVADHALILAACRQAVEHRCEYRNDKDQWGALHEDTVLILAPLPLEIPEPLRKLNPIHLIINEDQINISMPLPFCRIGLKAFKSGAEEYGTFKYIDGLWFWNGRFESIEMENRVRRIKSKD